MSNAPDDKALAPIVEKLCANIVNLVDLLEYSHGKPMTEKQVAQRLGISLRTVKRRIKSKAIKCFQDEGVVRVRPADLERYIEKNSGGDKSDADY